MADDETNTDDGPKHDYLAVSPPPDVAPENLHYVPRRAEILDRILQVGSPSGIDRAQLADHYQKNRSTIKRDVDALVEYLGDYLDEIIAETFALRRRVLSDLLHDDDWRASARAWEIQTEWAFDVLDVLGDDADDEDDPRHPAYRDRRTGESANPGFGVSDEQRAAFKRMRKQAEKATEPLRVDSDRGGHNDTNSGGGDE